MRLDCRRGARRLRLLRYRLAGGRARYLSGFCGQHRLIDRRALVDIVVLQLR